MADQHGFLVFLPEFHRHITYYPPKDWSVYLPVSALLLFLSAPILYAAFNSITVPRLDSIDTIKDDYTRTPTCPQAMCPAYRVPHE